MRRVRTIRLPLLSLGMLMVALLGCDGGAAPPVDAGPSGTTQPARTNPPTVTPPPPKLADPAVSIYRRVVDDLVRRGEQHGYVNVYIGPRLGSGATLDVHDASPTTPPDLVAALSDLTDGNGGTARVQFSSFAAVTGPPEDGAVVQNGGAFITLGDISYHDPAGAATNDPATATSATVRASLYQSRADAVGVIYTFTRTGSDWQLQTTTEEWRAQGVG